MLIVDRSWYSSPQKPISVTILRQSLLTKPKRLFERYRKALLLTITSRPSEASPFEDGSSN